MVIPKSNTLAQDKVVHDIERVLDFVDKDSTGYFNMDQIGQVLTILKVFKSLYT